MSKAPEIRIRRANDQPLRGDGDYVLYWMTANRRLRYNFALDRALEHCEQLHKPLVVFEALRVGYRWASDRIHRFILDGMAENAGACAAHGVSYFPYVESRVDEGKGLLTALGERTCVIVTDDYPCFFLPKMVESAGKQVPVLLEAVDSNGLLPIRVAGKAAARAFDFRRFLQKELPKHLEYAPSAEPLRRAESRGKATLAKAVLAKWSAASPELLSGSDDALGRLSIDHAVKPTPLRGGSKAACRQMSMFLGQRFVCYLQDRNDPDHAVTSGLSPYLHFGHLSVHELFAEVAKRERWSAEKLSLRANGQRQGWWNMSASAEAFLDQAITWRELGFNFSARRRDHAQYESLPEWARKTLKEHARDKREHVYTSEQFEGARTHDPLWNAAQTQLVREGRIHNYLRMLWGKKILEWTRVPQDALEIMIHLNNKYALDGRDPNSYSGIFWTLGRYDRPWGPERPVFGTVRYMSSTNTARKVSVRDYVRRYSAE